MGASERGTDPISVEQMADDAAAVVDAAGWESAHVVGHSLGGPVGLQLGLTDRRLVRSLALMCSFARGKDVGPLSWTLTSAGIRKKLGTQAMRRRAFLELVVPTGASADRDALGRTGTAVRTRPSGFAGGGEGPDEGDAGIRCVRSARAIGRSAHLIANAEYDPIAPPKLGRAAAGGVPGAKYVDLGGASHGVILTDPQWVNALLEAHLAAAG